MTITEEVRFAKKYLLGNRIGRGAMGNVYEAKVDDGSLDRVAIKILKSELISEEKTVARFIQEGEIFRLISHENVIQVLDVIAEDDQLAIVMELVPDGDLRQMMKRGAITPTLAVKIAADVAAGLEATHEANVVHRDLKPPNILMVDTDEGWVAKIADFGISRLLDDATTRSSTTIGTPLYMAPESVGKGGPESPADIYGLGIIIFELLIGHAPFHEGGTLGVIRSHADDTPPVLHGVPEELSQLVNEMLEKDPEQRPSAEQAHARLLALLPLMDDSEVPYELPALEESLFEPDDSVVGEDDNDDEESGIWLASRRVAVGGRKAPSFVSGLAARVSSFADRLPVSNLNLIAGTAFTAVLLAIAGFSIFATGNKEMTVARSDVAAPSASSTTVGIEPGADTTIEQSEDLELPAFGQGQAPGSVRPERDLSPESTATTIAAPARNSEAVPRPTRRSATTAAQTTAAPVTAKATTLDRPTTVAPPTTAAPVTVPTTAASLTTVRPTTSRPATTRPTTTRKPTTTLRPTTTVKPPTTPAPTTAPPTTAAPTTAGPGSAPIRIISGPSVVSRGPTSITFAYTTNQVCGTGSFSYTNNATGASAGRHVGDNGCFGPAHYGRSHWGTVNLEPGTSYTVNLTVHGKPSNGSLATGTGSVSRTFQVSTTP